MRYFLASLVLLHLLPAPVLFAQEAHAGHAMPRSGHVRFPTSCRPAAQAPFERGVTLLHSFWYEEATTAFREAAAADSGCAMAHWGVAMSYLHPLWAAPTPADLREGAAAVARARAAHPPTPREQAWVEAAGAFYDSSATIAHGVRLRNWERALARLHEAQPADTEATIDWSLALIATQSKTDTSYGQLRQAAAMLEPLFRTQPQHPGLSHYLIHAYDAPALVARATTAANRYAAIAPDVPHALHMPSHSYSLLGMWDRSITANTRAADIARRFETDQHLDGVWDQRLHAMDYLVYAYLQQGRNDAAWRLVEQGNAITRTVPANGLTSEFALAAMPARWALERGDWAAASVLVPREAPIPLVQAVTAFARSLGAARVGDVAAARAGVQTLADLEARAATGTDPFAPPMIRVNRLVAQSWLALATGDTAVAIRTATEAAEAEEGALKNPLTPGPLLSARELLGDMYAEIGNRQLAAVAYRKALVNTPARRRSVQGLRAVAR